VVRGRIFIFVCSANHQCHRPYQRKRERERVCVCERTGERDGGQRWNLNLCQCAHSCAHKRERGGERERETLVKGGIFIFADSSNHQRHTAYHNRERQRMSARARLHTRERERERERKGERERE